MISPLTVLVPVILMAVLYLTAAVLQARDHIGERTAMTAHAAVSFGGLCFSIRVHALTGIALCAVAVAFFTWAAVVARPTADTESRD